MNGLVVIPVLTVACVSVALFLVWRDPGPRRTRRDVCGCSLQLNMFGISDWNEFGGVRHMRTHCVPVRECIDEVAE